VERRLFWFDEDDDTALAAVMQRYRCKTKSQAVRLALSLVASGRAVDVSPAQVAARDYRQREKANAAGKEEPRVLLKLLQLAEDNPIHGLPEDFSERLDEYLYGDLRPAGLTPE
jgi:hypothetical protein